MLLPASLGPVVRDRLYEQVAQQIQQMIVDQGWPTGNRIPTERELGEQFGVSRTVIREALKALAERGLISISAGRGTFVADRGIGALKEPMKLFFQRHNVSYRDLVEARRVLEIEIAGLAAERARPEQIGQLYAALGEMDGSMEDVEEYVRTDQRFHLLLAQATQNQMFPMLTESMAELLHESRHLIFGVAGAPARGQSHHRAILESLERRDPAAARRAMGEHLDQVDTDIHATGS
ncbi:MAG: FadR/GntR family transcriptional regulator [Chloroflexota bacterium]